MKKKTLSTLIFIFIAFPDVIAQPSPPTGPEGNPIPIGLSSFLLLAIGTVLIFWKIRNEMK